MRLIAADTETTGLYAKQGDRIIELAMVDITRDPNPRTFHSLFDPEGREVSPEAYEVHGHSTESLVGQPLFRDRLPEIIDFIGDGTLVIHNAGFDLEFLREECLSAGLDWIECPVIDTMREAIKENPNGRHSLDALCMRYGVDLSKRVKHGALIDTELLAQVYLIWKGQAGLDFAPAEVRRAVVSAEALGEMNMTLVRVPSAVLAAPPGQNWAKHFDGIDL